MTAEIVNCIIARTEVIYHPEGINRYRFLVPESCRVHTES
jgi:hypothetical protein